MGLRVQSIEIWHIYTHTYIPTYIHTYIHTYLYRVWRNAFYFDAWILRVAYWLALGAEDHRSWRYSP